MIHGGKVFDQPVKSDLRKCDNIRKIATGQEDDYTADCLLDYPYFKKYKRIAVYLSKQQALDADLKAIRQIHFTGNLDWAESTTILFIIEEAKDTIVDFSQGTMRVLWMCSTVCFTLI